MRRAARRARADRVAKARRVPDSAAADRQAVATAAKIAGRDAPEDVRARVNARQMVERPI